MSTQTILDLKYNRKKFTPTSVHHKIEFAEEEENKYNLSCNGTIFDEGCEFVKMVNTSTEAFPDLLKQTHKKSKEDNKLLPKTNDNDLISITPASSPYQKKSYNNRLSRSIKSDSSHPYFTDTLKLYAKLTKNRIKDKPVVNNPSLLLTYKNFYSSSFSLQPGFSFGHLPRVFPPKFEVPGPGAYNVHLMELYMKHIPGPIYKESKLVTLQYPSSVLKTKDLQVSQLTNKKCSDINDFQLYGETPTDNNPSSTASIKERNVEFNNQIMKKTCIKDNNTLKLTSKAAIQNYPNIKKQQKNTNISKFPLKTQIKTFDRNLNIKKNFKTLNVQTGNNKTLLNKNIATKNDDLSYPYLTKCVGIEYLPYEID